MVALLLGDRVHGQTCEADCAADCSKVSSEKARTNMERVKDVRLPTHLVPVSYDIRLIPFIIPGNFTIRGGVKVRFLKQCHRNHQMIFRLRWNVLSLEQTLLFMQLISK